jgi:hypothetical protein
MPKLAHNFVQGKMNKDLDERLVPPGQYRDALNIQVSTSEGSDVGAVENILGNTKLNKKSSSVNWAANFGLTSAQCIGAARDTQNNKLYWFVTSASVDAILEYDEATGFVAPILVDTGTVLNFNTANFITGVNVFEGLLCWTDNLNEPRKILISRFKAGSANQNGTQAGTSIDTHTQVYSRPFVASDITVIKKKPNERLHYTAASSTRTGNGVGLDRVTTDKTFVETVGGERVTMDIGSARTFTTSAAPNWENGDIITLRASEFNNDRNADDNYEVRMQLTANPSGVALSFINAKILSISSGMPDIELTWECELQEDPPMFEFSFPRFAYRWKYVDGEISAFSPWTNAIFVPGPFEYGSYDAYNEGMVNNLRKLTLSGFETPPADVDKVEILYKDSSENIIYRIEELSPSTASLAITSEIAVNVIDSNQILRPYDNVPLKALAQEVIGNRLVYGNYIQQNNIAHGVDLSTDLQSNNIAAVKTPEESVKSLRDYQIGVVYIDEHGRETPVFTNSYSTVKIGIDKASKVNKLKAQVENLSPGPWAKHFKYYVKETSNEYYNVSLDRYYADPDGFMWLSIPSAERNKVQDGDFLILKKQHNTDLPVTSEAKFKVLDISNEAPDAVAVKRKFKSLVGITRGTAATKIATGLTEFTFEGPTPNAGNDHFVDALQADVYVRFIYGANKTGFYKVVTGGYSGLTNAGYSLEISEELQLTDASFINALTTEEFKLELHEEKRLTLPEYQGRFFVKINRSTAFDENVLYNFTNNPEDYKEKGNTDAHPGDIIFDNPDNTGEGVVLTELGWAEHANANVGGVVLTGKPTANSKKFGVIQSPYVSGTTPGTIGGTNGSKMADFVTGAEAGDFIQFGSAAGIWSNLYTLNSVIKGTYSRNASPTGNTDDETGYRWEFTLNEPYTDTDIAADRFRLAERKRQQPTVIDENSEVLPSMNPAVFEVEPKEAIDLELYYEASEAYPISALDTEHTLDYFNCYSFGNGVESDRIRDDFNAKRIGKGVKVSSIIETEYKQERRKAGLIYSGLFNNTSGVNELNQFIQGLKITKDLNPVYGGIQILKARDTDLVTLCEDKCFKIQANKDALFTADGNPNVTSTNNVLGQTIAYAGEFGISNNPESFTTYGFRSYFTDKARGTVIRLSMDGITEIAENGMSDYFEDKLKAASGAIIGSYDEAGGSYNVSFSSDESVAFKEGVRGWTSRMSFVPEAAISLNNDYYTMKNGELWVHNSATRSNFYGAQANSTVTPIFNDAPSSIKNFKTLSYEGDAGWVADVLTDQQDGEVEAWKKKENFYFNYIKGKATTLANIDTGEFSVQGLGNPSATTDDTLVIDGVQNQVYEITFVEDLNVSLQLGDIIYFTDASNSDTLVSLGAVLQISGNTVNAAWDGSSAEPSTSDFILFAKDSEKNTSGIIGYHASVEMKTTSSDKKELFAVNSEVFISSE